MSTKKSRMGMIGGSKHAFIGAVHRTAARMDGMIDLVAGCFSSHPETSLETGIDLGLDTSRVYASYEEMIRTEKQLPEDQRIQIVSIVTPNHLHFHPAKLALEAGFHVILDKPMTFSLEEAYELEKIVDRSQKQFCVTYTYSGYPMVKEAKVQIARGAIGQVRKVYVEYPQGWLSTYLESAQHKQASWRTDPTKSGLSGSMGDIGTHAFHLAEYVTGLRVSELCADINTVVPQRKLDDDGAVLLRFNNGASGILCATQIAAGEECGLKIRVYGEKGGIEWKHTDPNSLLMKWLDQPTQIIRTGTDYVSTLAKMNTRIPAGHPEGYLEAFANVYNNFAIKIATTENRMSISDPTWVDFPNIKDGVRGMEFIQRVIDSGKSTQKWTHF